MNEDDLRVFIDGAIHYFSKMSQSPAVIQTPYLKENESPLTHEYTGIIGISGRNKGCVYFTAPGSLLKHFLLSIGEDDTSHEALCDLVGEVANTISGNARKYFGAEFLISVPVVVDGQPNAIRLPQNARSYIIPLLWRSYEATLVISLE